MIEARHLKKTYWQGPWYSRDKFQVAALDDVSLTIEPCSTVALVGESGAGKSTLGRCLCRLEEPDSGEVWFDGKNLFAVPQQRNLSLRGDIQFVFQDSATALNPRFSAAEAVEEPLLIQGAGSKKERRRQALTMMEQVGLSPAWAERSTVEFSGGQRQRLSLARALVLKPRLLILDEALSGLDLVIQAQMTNLLLELKASLHLTYLFITHDLRLAAQLADRITVMRQGKIVESGTVPDILFRAQHTYTRQLVTAIPPAPTDKFPLLRRAE
jgi:ABC-type glutathione transport system ATPase component